MTNRKRRQRCGKLQSSGKRKGSLMLKKRLQYKSYLKKMDWKMEEVKYKAGKGRRGIPNQQPSQRVKKLMGGVKRTNNRIKMTMDKKHLRKTSLMKTMVMKKIMKAKKKMMRKMRLMIRQEQLAQTIVNMGLKMVELMMNIERYISNLTMRILV